LVSEPCEITPRVGVNRCNANQYTNNAQIKYEMMQRSLKERLEAVYPAKGSELLPRDSSK